MNPSSFATCCILFTSLHAITISYLPSLRRALAVSLPKPDVVPVITQTGFPDDFAPLFPKPVSN